MSKSWTGLRKELEQSFICDALKGRVQYFLTHYHSAPDQDGRFAIRVDGKEVLHANPYGYDQKYNELLRETKSNRDIPKRVWTLKEMLHDKENMEVEKEIETLANVHGTFEIYHITDAIREYLNQPIDKSINSENPIIRMFAVMDRRVGKRMLEKIEVTVNNQPQWLKYFYELRYQAEGLKNKR